MSKTTPPSGPEGDEVITNLESPPVKKPKSAPKPPAGKPPVKKGKAPVNPPPVKKPKSAPKPPAGKPPVKKGKAPVNPPPAKKPKPPTGKTADSAVCPYCDGVKYRVLQTQYQAYPHQNDDGEDCPYLKRTYYKCSDCYRTFITRSGARDRNE